MNYLSHHFLLWLMIDCAAAIGFFIGIFWAGAKKGDDE